MQRLLAQAAEAEVEAWIATHEHLTDSDGHHFVARNSHLPGRTVLSGVGPVKLRQP